MAKRRIKQLVQFDTCILTPTVGKAETNEVGISPCLYLDAPCIRATHGFNYQVLEEEEQKTGMNMMTFVILAAVIIGMLIGYFGIRQMFAGNMDLTKMT